MSSFAMSAGESEDPSVVFFGGALLAAGDAASFAAVPYGFASCAGVNGFTGAGVLTPFGADIVMELGVVERSDRGEMESCTYLPDGTLRLLYSQGYMLTGHGIDADVQL